MIWRSYYFIGSVRVAVIEAFGAASVLSYIVTDRLGGTNQVVNSSIAATQICYVL